MRSICLAVAIGCLTGSPSIAANVATSGLSAPTAPTVPGEHIARLPAKPGEIGRRVEVTGDGHYRPVEIPLADRTAKMTAARASLPAELASLGGD